MNRYEHYKDSGIEWIGEIPEHWEVRRWRNLFKVEKGRKPSVDFEENDGTMLPYLTMEVLRGQADPKIFVKPEDGVRTYFNDLLLLWDGSNAGEFIKSSDGILSSTTARIMVHSARIEETFPFWLAKALEPSLKAATIGMGIPHVDGTSLKEEILPLPPLSEQTAIAAYLDRQTAEIDATLARKEAMLQKLEDLRAARIHEVVTRGLNTDAPLKDSGVEWIGEIPETWEVRRLKNVIVGNLKYGANEAAELDDPMLPRYIRITDFDNDGSLRTETFKSLPEEVAQCYLLQEGDILFARSGATFGKTFQFKNYVGKACFAGYLIKATPNADVIISDYLYYFTKTHSYDSWKSSIVIQATIQNISAEKYRNLFLPLPPLSEQTAIADYLDAFTQKVDALREQLKAQMALLRQYRQSLITEVVTGKQRVG